jgi:molybdate transport system substrate-binding protein
MTRFTHAPTLALILSLAPVTLTPARADYVPAPDVVVFCEPTLQPTVAAIARDWRRHTGVPVHIFPLRTEAEIEEAAHHPRVDLIIGEGDAQAAAAAERGLIKPETKAPLWRGRLVVAAMAKAGDKSGLAVVAGTAKVAVVDPWAATAGADGQAALQALGLWDRVESRSIGVVDTADAAFLLTEGKVERAVLYASDVAADPHLAVAEGLADTLYPPVLYWVAETPNALSPNTAAFETALRQGAATATANGLEVLP